MTTTGHAARSADQPLSAFNRLALADGRGIMKKIILTLALLALPLPAKAQTMSDTNLTQRIQDLEDKAALKNLVDTFSELADQKDITKQVLLFTDDATVESYNDGKLGSSFKGRKQIGDAFGGFLALFETVYHLNGQQTVEVHGDTATGVSYCQVTLVAVKDGKKTRNTSGVYYNDEYVRRDGHWLIAKRTSHFTWSDSEAMATPTQ